MSDYRWPVEGKTFFDPKELSSCAYLTFIFLPMRTEMSQFSRLTSYNIQIVIDLLVPLPVLGENKTLSN